VKEEYVEIIEIEETRNEESKWACLEYDDFNQSELINISKSDPITKRVISFANVER